MEKAASGGLLVLEECLAEYFVPPSKQGRVRGFELPDGEVDVSNVDE